MNSGHAVTVLVQPQPLVAAFTQVEPNALAHLVAEGRTAGVVASFKRELDAGTPTELSDGAGMFGYRIGNVFSAVWAVHRLQVHLGGSQHSQCARTYVSHSIQRQTLPPICSKPFLMIGFFFVSIM